MRILFSFFAMLMLPTLLNAQTFPVEKYKSNKVTWYGIDYTKIKLIGDAGFSDTDNIVKTYFNAWNNFVLSEPNKYYVRGYLHKPDINIDLELVKEHNALVDANSLIVSKANSISQDEVNELLETYNFKNTEGIGVMLIAEYYSKNDVRASYLYVICDTQSKSILFSRRYYAAPKGFGFRNYWAYTIYRTLKSIDQDMRMLMR